MQAQEKESPQKLGFYFDPSTTNDNVRPLGLIAFSLSYLHNRCSTGLSK